MKIQSNRLNRRLVALVAVMLVATQLWGCSTAQPKKDGAAEKVKKTDVQKLAEKMGMSVDTVKAFQNALAELNKPKTDTQTVEKLLTKVIEAQPDFAEAHYDLGIAYSNALRYDEAIDHLERAREIDPDNLDHTVALAQAYAVTEHYDKATKLFEEVVARQPKNLTAKNNLAVLALKAGHVDEAMDHVQDVLREDYENVGALSTLGLINKKRENISLAKFALNEAIELSKDNPDADLFNNLGLVYMMEDKVPQAVEQFEAANKADPDYLESRLNLGAILIEYLAYQRASKLFGQAVRIAPKQCVGRLGKAAADYGLGAGGNEGASKKSAQNFEYYLDNCDAENVSTHERLAKLYETRLKNPKKAAQHYQKLSELVDKKKKREYYKAMANTMRSQIKSDEPKSPDKEAEETGGDVEQQPGDAEQDDTSAQSSDTSASNEGAKTAGSSDAAEQ